MQLRRRSLNGPYSLPHFFSSTRQFSLYCAAKVRQSGDSASGALSDAFSAAYRVLPLLAY